MINEVMEEVEQELEKVDAEEVEADEYADTLAHHVDYEDKLGIDPKVTKESLEDLYRKESKAMRLAKVFRKQRLALQESYKKNSLQKENAKLKATIEKIKNSK